MANPHLVGHPRPPARTHRRAYNHTAQEGRGNKRNSRCAMARMRAREERGWSASLAHLCAFLISPARQHPKTILRHVASRRSQLHAL